MSHSRGYALAELAFTVIVLGLIFALVLPILSFGRSGRPGCARQMQSSTQVRGIIQGLVNYAPGNNAFYPGLTAQGTEDTAPLPPGPAAYGTASISGYDPAYRFTILLRNSYFTPEYAISPQETDDSKTPVALASLTQPVPATLGLVTNDSFSFALLRIDDAAGEGRHTEWASTTNSKAAVVSDRNLAAKAGADALSIHTDKGWRGTVGYNDNHVNFETSNILSATSYGGKGEVPADDLFADDNNNTAKAGADAGMVYQDAKTYVNQK